MYISPPRVYLLCIESPPCGVPFVWCPLPVDVSLSGCSFMYIASIYMSLCVYVTPCACSFRIYVPPCLRPFSCVSPSVYIFLSMIVVGIRNLQIIGWCGRSVGAHVCNHVSSVVEVRSMGYRGSCLCPRQFCHLSTVNELNRLTSVTTSVRPMSTFALLLVARLSFCHCVSVYSLVVSCVSIET